MNFYVTGGTLAYDAPSYVVREADDALFEGLRRGDYCHVLTSRQMGKSSLMVSTSQRLRQQGIHVVALDLTAIGGQNLTPEQWYFGLLDGMGQQLDLEEELEDFWETHTSFSCVRRLFQAVEQVVLPALEGRIAAGPAGSPVRLVIFVDEIDFVRALPFSSDEFFAAIRECYTRRTQNARYQMITFCLLGVATPSSLIQQAEITPFNVGQRILLHDFTPEESSGLAHGFQEAPKDGNCRELGPVLLDRVLHWTSGQPYLTQTLCHETLRSWIKQSSDQQSLSPHAVHALVDEVCTRLFFGSRARERDDNLVFVRERILRSPQDRATLLDLYQKIRRGRKFHDDETDPFIGELLLSGLIKVGPRGYLRVRNRIYHKVFDEEWITANMPRAELRRQREAYKKGVFRTALVGLVVFLILAGAIRSYLTTSQKAHVSLGILVRNSGQPGQRLGSLDAFRRARRFYPDQKQLQSEAIASLAYFDIESLDLPLPEMPAAEVTTRRMADSPDHYILGDDSGNILFTPDPGPISSPAMAMPGFSVSWIQPDPDFHHAVVAYQNGDSHRTVLWDLKDRRPLHTEEARVLQNAVDFSRDGHWVALGAVSPTSQILIVSLKAPSIPIAIPMQTRTLLERPPNCVRFHPDAALVACSSSIDQNVTLVDFGNEPARFVSQLYHKSRIRDLDWHPSGNHLAVASADGNIYLWQTRVPAETKTNRILKGHAQDVLDVQFCHKGSLLASLDLNRGLRVWIPESGRSLVDHSSLRLPGRLRFTRDDKILLCESGVAAPGAWKIHRSREYQVFRGTDENTGSFNCLQFDPSGRYLVAGGPFSGIMLFDTERHDHQMHLKGDAVSGIRFESDFGSIQAASLEGMLNYSITRTVSAGTPVLFFRSSPHRRFPDVLIGLSETAETQTVATIHNDHFHVAPARGMDLDFGQIGEMGQRIQALGISPDGEFVAGWTELDRQIHLFQRTPQNYEAKGTFPGNRDFAFTPDSRRLILHSENAFRFLNLETAEFEPTLVFRHEESPSQDVPLAVISLDEGRITLLAFSLNPGSIELYEVKDHSFRFVARLRQPDPLAVSRLSFSPSGTRLAAVASEQVIQVWNLARLGESLQGLNLASGFPLLRESGSPLPSLRFELSPEGPQDSNEPIDNPHVWNYICQHSRQLTGTASLEQSYEETLLLRAGLFFQCRMYSEAIRDLELLLEQVPDHVKATEMLAQLRNHAGQSGRGPKP